MTTASASQLILSRLNGWPIRTPADACPRGLAADDARLGADAVRYSFIVVDLHHLLPAGLPARCHVWTAPLVKGFVEALANVSGAVMSPAC